MAQQHLRNILAHFNSIVLGQPETFLQFSHEVFTGNGEIANAGTQAVVQGLQQ